MAEPIWGTYVLNMADIVKSWNLGASDVADYRNVSKMCKTKWKIQYGGHIFEIWQISSKVGIWGLPMSLITETYEKCVKTKWWIQYGGHIFEIWQKSPKLGNWGLSLPLLSERQEKCPKPNGGPNIRDRS